MYLWHNQGCLFEGFTPANRPELMTCVFTTYSRYLDTYAHGAQQQWGSQGIWIPATTWFNGLEDLPENIAAEMRDLYLARKPWSERSKEFDDYARNKNGLNSRWNYRYTANQKGPFAWTSHVMSTTAKIANLYWLHYAYLHPSHRRYGVVRESKNLLHRARQPSRRRRREPGHTFPRARHRRQPRPG